MSTLMMKAMESSSSMTEKKNEDFNDDNEEDEIVLYSQRWVQLGYLACLALISDWVCFSVAATPGTLSLIHI